MPTIINAIEENAQALRRVVAKWPELAQTIEGLREQGVFPGLRCMTLTLDAGVTLASLVSGAEQEASSASAPQAGEKA